MATTLFLVRHAAHDRVHDTLTGRTPGVSLGAAGRAQAEWLAERLGREAVEAVLCSPLERAHETAAPIAARLGLEAVVDPGLLEIDFGAWTGMRFDALATDAGWRHWNAARGSARPPAGRTPGESMAEAQRRALDAVERARAAHAEAGVVLVSHADVIRAVLLAVLGMPLDAFHRIEVSPASVSVVSAWEGGARLLGLNEIPPPG
ncbi:histidine phosphatase family protein [Roseomonas sp. BN140053]|uniref:histidine phosphatase family protein n=1 Tax=Roseomonas sp. BN140053 TaxID=3391898 RepID=UPI0039E7C960